MGDSSIVLLFLKSPEKGKVKSRLAKAIGEDAAFEVYKCLAVSTLDKLKKGDYDFKIFFYPPESEANVRTWLENSRCFSYEPQNGSDLGERMKNAFIRAFSAGAEKVVLIGSDIPGLSISLLDGALKSLDTIGAVIGPADDGGYYLIGFAKDAFLPEVFQGIEWGSGTVFCRTMDIFNRKGVGVSVLKMLTDVDTYEDLKKTGFMIKTGYR